LAKIRLKQIKFVMVSTFTRLVIGELSLEDSQILYQQSIDEMFVDG
jgi:hypothetical protein